MMLNSMQMEKLRLIDKIFESLSVDDIRELSEREEIVARLKGVPHHEQPLTNLAIEHQQAQTQLMTMQGELASLKYDLQVIVKALLKPYDYGTQSDITTLKSKYNIY